MLLIIDRTLLHLIGQEICSIYALTIIIISYLILIKVFTGSFIIITESLVLAVLVNAPKQYESSNSKIFTLFER
jgi:hypothetical protein